MSAFESAFAAWLLFFTNLDVGIEPQLLPPATVFEISAVSDEIGFELPKDFISLYLKGNGQENPYLDDRPRVESFAPLFGWYEFIPLELVLRNYNDFIDMQQSMLPDVYEVDVREGDPVAGVDWQPGWVPFAVSNAAYYAVDLTPLRGGRYGQVIEIGHDTVENRVLAASITDFLTLAATHLDPNEQYRYEVYKADQVSFGSRDFSSLYFNMDWTQAPDPPLDPEDYEPDPGLEAWNDANHAAVSVFSSWLEGKGYGEADLDIFRRWVFEMHMPLTRRMGGLLSPPMPDQVQLEGNADIDYLYELVSLDMALRAPTNYVVDELPVPLEAAFTLVNEYHLEMGVWNKKQFSDAQRIINRERPERVSIMDEASTSSFTSVEERKDGSLLVCTESFHTDGQQNSDCEVFAR